MRYWKNEIKVFFEPNVPLHDKKALENFAVTLSEVSDSLKIKFVDNFKDTKKSNILLNTFLFFLY